MFKAIRSFINTLNCLAFIVIWIYFVAVTNFILILKHGFSYFKSVKTINYPDCVMDSKYGQSKMQTIQTTKGVGMDAVGLKLHYIGKSDKKPKTMLFLHGFPEFWFSWRHQLLEFSKTHRVLALDMRGYGMSDKPSNVADYQIKHLINDIKGFLDALDIRSVILLGHDWGGVVAWKFENAYPEMVEKLIALNMPEPTFSLKVFNGTWSQFFKSWYILFFQCPYLPEWSLSRFNLAFIAEAFNSKTKGLQKTKLSTEEIDAFKANMAQPGCLTASINYYRASFRYRSKSDQKPNFKRSESNRYMLIFGDNDAFIRVAYAKETKTFVPNINLRLLPGLSHWVQQDDPVLVNNLIREFVETET